MKRTRTKDVEAKLKEGKCIHEGCDEPLDRRGCCQTHYGQFYDALKNKPNDAAKIAFEELMIREGLILAPYEMRHRRSTNPFLHAEREAS